MAVPPLLLTSLVWGLFLGVSANMRYQLVFGVERLVDLTIAKRVPQVGVLVGGDGVCVGACVGGGGMGLY